MDGGFRSCSHRKPCSGESGKILRPGLTVNISIFWSAEVRGPALLTWKEMPPPMGGAPLQIGRGFSRQPSCPAVPHQGPDAGRPYLVWDQCSISRTLMAGIHCRFCRP